MGHTLAYLHDLNSAFTLTWFSSDVGLGTVTKCSVNRAEPNRVSTVRFGSIVSVNTSLTVPTDSEAVSGRAE